MIRKKNIIKLPDFDSGQYNGAKFSNAGNAELLINVIELGAICIVFNKCRFVRYTANYNCDADMVESYFQVDEIIDSIEVSEYVRNDRATKKAYDSLSHYIIYLDGTGCYEIFAQSVNMKLTLDDKS